MPFFKNSDFEIVYREFEFNSEYLDGILDKIDQQASVILLVHTPTKQFKWQCNILKELPFSNLEDLYEETSIKNGEKSNLNPTPFYKIISKADLEEYLKKHEYILIQHPVGEPPKKIDGVITNINLPERHTKPDEVSQTNEVPRTKLVRDSQPSIYTFIAPKDLKI